MTQRWGLVGFGRFGQLHARAITKAPGAELAAICVASETTAAAARWAHPEARILRDVEALLADPHLDVIDIVAPNHLHAGMAIAALEAGKHVLVEKPMAATLADCDALVAAAEGARGRLCVGLELRHSIQWGRIKRLIDEGRIGRPRYAAVSLFRHPYRAGASGWRQAADLVGSWILEEPVHFYDLALWYLEALGEPVSVTAHGTRAAGAASGMYDNFASIVRYADGGFVTVTQSLAGFGHHLVVEVAGSEGAIRSTWSAAEAASETPAFELLVGPAGLQAPERIELTGSSGEVFELDEEIRLAAEAFARGRTLLGAAEAAKSLRVCLAAERSVVDGREIVL
ncbi:MAG: Gfo/Idh/MocA family oxidoreductase [Geminicoccaceae bacterium]|nr:Gfo/Idh/MocA family oxidoreductase [Geminicoccaceae bacterium]